MKRKLFLLLNLVLIVGVIVINTLNPKGRYPFLAEIPTLDLSAVHKILVLAPHCDDETLGSAGLIQAALKAGVEVRVAILTNGDGFLFATMEDFRKIYPRQGDFVRMGNLRQQESTRALGLLGVPPEKITFLSFPDRGTPSLWNFNWSHSRPYSSPYTHATRSPYPTTFDPRADYSGEDILADLTHLIDDYRPDLIVYPHPEDVHPDHWGLSAFTRLTLLVYQRTHPDYRPALYAYLIHRPDFPYPSGLHLTSPLLPPLAVWNMDTHWLRINLNDQQVIQKQAAVKQYQSQLPLLHTLLYSFIRPNELFAQPQPVHLPVIAHGDLHDPGSWRDVDHEGIPPIQLDPEKDFIVRKLLAADDLVAVYAARDSADNLAVCLQVRGQTRGELIYALHVKIVDEAGFQDVIARNHRLHNGFHHLYLNGDYGCDVVKLKNYASPWLLFVGADVEDVGTGILDQSAWQAVLIP